MPALPRVDRIKTVYSAAKALNYGWTFSGFLEAPLYNGVSRCIPQIHRITFRFCKQSEDSVGVRNFIENKLLDLGEQWPSVVLYTQPVRNSIPIIRAEYGNGRIVQLNAKNMSMSDIERDVMLLFSRSGQALMKLESRQSSPTPSVQGEWTPMTWLPPDMNAASLPNPEFSKHKTCKMTATDFLLEEQKRHERIRDADVSRVSHNKDYQILESASAHVDKGVSRTDHHVCNIRCSRGYDRSGGVVLTVLLRTKRETLAYVLECSSHEKDVTNVTALDVKSVPKPVQPAVHISPPALELVRTLFSASLYDDDDEMRLCSV
ncbi:hypothetical protein RB195_006573 [Necator americanus]|uniref:Large ribosomal subunit protein mL43 n=1 Tax=Necator americanus TaxID=51031 RepID=A0ABR1BT92_NECAM